MEYYGKNGKYSLASQPMKQGGEGAIYAINGRSDLVAKIYFKERVTAELAEKLAFMSNNPPDASILSQIAWPQDVLREQNGDFVGFVMPKLKIDSDLKEIYVYPPKKNLQITYDQKIIIAINICVVISAIHKAGYTFGDFNPLNIGVNLSTGHVAFLDTDSYHIYDKYNRKMYRCGVCLDGYVAPELIQQCKGTDYLSAPLPTFTQETDKFALAIHIFKLLMNGFTPFNGIKETDSVSQASPGRGNQAIEKDNYCFKAGNKPQSVATPDLSAFPPDIQYLFKRAFIDGRENPEYRPSADEWYKALLDYKKNLVQCKRDVNHFYYVNDRECPYCAAEDRYNASLGRPSSSSQMTFSQPISVPGTSTSNSGNYRPTSASSPRVSGSSNSSYVGASGYQTSSTHKKKGNFTKKLIGWVITLGILGALFGFVVWPKMIYPNMANEDLYTPEIIQTYSGTYAMGKTKGNAVVTITSCDQSGNLTGFFEFIVGNTYGKYEITGKITEKKNNGNLVLSLTPGQWVIQPDEYSPLETMTVEITDAYQSFECSQYRMYWSIGGNDEYSIKTVDDLQKLVGSEATYQLKNDIDLSGVNWTPIEGFKGTFMGNGYTIKNLKIETSASNVGFFSTLTGTVANLNFENAEIKVTGYQKNVGILCGTLEGSVSSIKVSGSVIADSSENVGGIAGSIAKLGDFSIGTLENTADVTGNERVGGIAGYFGGSWNSSYSTRTLQINSVSNAGKISGHSNYVGGIFGELYCKNTGSSQIVQIYDVNNKGDVSGLTYVGGIFGNAYSNDSSSFVDRAVSNGSISAEAMVGCIAGKVSNITLNNCTNEGSKLVATKYITEDGKKLAYVGGIVGHGYMVNDSINSVAIEYTSEGNFVGGIAGKLSVLGNVGLKNLKNNANVSGKEYVGGIAGYFGGSWNASYSQRTMTINTFVNAGNIKAEGNYSGGIFGELYCNNTGASQVVQMYDTENQGDVSGKLYVGGVFGNAYTNSSASILDRATSSSKVAAEAMVGCIAGKASNIVFNNCTNEGSALTATKYITEDGKKLAYVGGIVGYGYIVNNSTNSVNIAYTSEGHYVGGIAGRLGVLGNVGVENLENKANIQGKEYVGGIAGSFGGSWNESYSQRTMTINSLKNSGNILASGSYVGGIFGELYCKNTGASQVVQIYDSENFGDVSGKTYVGGIFGNAYTNSDASMIDRAVCKGNISAEAMVGCIVGKASGLVLNNCSNEGSTLSATKYITEEGKKKAYVGGIVGLGYIVNNSVNSVTIDYKSKGQYVGGIAGYLSALGNVNMENLENKANVTGYEHVGGIAGFFGGSWNASYSQRTIKINNMQNSGAIKATNGYVGGIFGELYCKNTGSSQVVQVYDSVNSGSVSGSSYIGGIFGKAYTNSSASFMMGCSTNTGKLAGKAENMSKK